VKRISLPPRIIGIDFSGARDAGARVWIAEAVADREGPLRVINCIKGEELPGSGRGREACLVALTAFLAEAGQAAIGLDFPFGLPLPLVQADTWTQFVVDFPERFPSVQDFRETCIRETCGKEHKRATDREARTPFSPYNLRLFRQTYYGLRMLVHPLIQNNRARAIPMQPPARGKPILLEICPATTLKRDPRGRDLYQPYKGRGDLRRRQRETILGHFEGNGRVAFETPAIRERLLADPGGDALDSVLAAIGTRKGITEPPDHPITPVHRLEGYVFG
jgi:hypothetical protein